MTASVFDRHEFNRALFFPRREGSALPAGANDRFVDVPGGRLHVRSYAAAYARCTLLLFHGNGEVVADYDIAASEFAHAGAALAVADYRGYGRSTGRPTLRAVIADAEPIARAVGGERPLVVMGRSLGAAAAHELYLRPVAGMVGVVLESAFFDLDGVVRRRGLEPPRTYTPEELAVFAPGPKLRAGKLPLLVLHGALDQLIVPGEASETFAAAGSDDKQLVLVPGRGHNDVSVEPAYWRALAAFLARVAP